MIGARNPVFSALALVMCFVTSAAIWLLIEAEFLAVVLVLVYVGAVMVLFLFVVMMLDINLAELRQGFTRFAWLGWLTALAVIVEIVGVVWARGRLGVDASRGGTPHPADYSNTLELGRMLYTRYAYPLELAAMLLLVAIVAAIALTMRHRAGLKKQDVDAQVAVRAAGPPAHRQDGRGEGPMITPRAAADPVRRSCSRWRSPGIFLNRKNVILLLMCVELLLLAANFNFIAFSRYLGDLNGQVFVFFVLTVAAAESAIGLAILVVLFRERRSINVEDLNTLKG